jgi:hypothetical protein
MGDAAAEAMAPDDTVGREGTARPPAKDRVMSDAFAFPQLERTPGNVNATRIAALGGLAVAVAAAIGVLVGRGTAGGQHPVVTAAVTQKPVHVVKHRAATPPPAKTKHHKTVLPAPGKTPVMVLNSGGVSGAAGDMAAKLQSYGYPTPVVTNARQHGVPPTVMYAPGYGPAARALARKVGHILYVTPLDGVKPSELHGAKLIVYVG